VIGQGPGQSNQYFCGTQASSTLTTTAGGSSAPTATSLSQATTASPTTAAGGSTAPTTTVAGGLTALTTTVAGGSTAAPTSAGSTAAQTTVDPTSAGSTAAQTVNPTSAGSTATQTTVNPTTSGAGSTTSVPGAPVTTFLVTSSTLITFSPGVTSVLITLVISGSSLSSQQLASLVQILASLARLNPSSFTIVIIGKRDVSVQVAVNDPSAASAGTVIVSTLSSDPSYLQARDATLGVVRSVSASASPATTPASGVNILAIVLPVVFGVILIGALVIVLALVLKKRRKSADSANDIYLHEKSSSPNPGYGMPI